MLRDNHEVSVAVAERLVAHRLVCRVDVHRHALAQRRVAVSSERLQPIDEVDLLVAGRDVERVPSELGRTELDLRVQRQEASLKLVDCGSESVSAI